MTLQFPWLAQESDNPKHALLRFALIRAMSANVSSWVNAKPLTATDVDKVLEKSPGLRKGLIEVGLVERDDSTGKSRVELVEEFLSSTCDVGNPKYRVEVPVLYQAYSDWCRRKRVIPLGRTVFGRTLREVLGEVKTVRPHKSRKQRKRPEVYVGIRLRPSDNRR